MDNATFTSTRLQGDGVPQEVANTVTGNHSGGKGARGKGGATRGGVTDDIRGYDEAQDNADDAIDDGDTPVGPFIWRGGKGDPSIWQGVQRPFIVNRDGRVSGYGEETDRTAIKLPSLFGMTNFGAITAQQAEQERLALEEERAVGSRVMFDPRTRKPIQPATGSKVRPEPNVKTPEPPKDDVVKPPPDSKAGVETIGGSRVGSRTNGRYYLAEEPKGSISPRSGPGAF
jgi:hypothetical protein